MSDRRCPVCGAERCGAGARLPLLQVFRCRGCGHRFAIHPGADERTEDYHEQYDAGGFLASLQATRRRQAEVLARKIRDIAGVDASILDFGAGRGWFLETCLEMGFSKLAGTDTSRLSIELLRKRGIEGILLDDRVDLPSFSPTVLTFLDVIEHFGATSLIGEMRSILYLYRKHLRLIVIKVPCSGGLLYRLAETMASAGAPGPLEQLYQVGTTPPHYHYFSKRSLGRLADALDLKVLETWDDLDFEPARFAERIHFLSRAPKALGSLAGRGAGTVARAFGLEDSTVFFLTPR